MRTLLRRLLLRLGLTGKFVLHVGWILALSLILTLGVTLLTSRTTIRDELRKTEIVRIERWASRHAAALHSEDRWRTAEVVAELIRDPYVVYAAVFDTKGDLAAQAGDAGAYTRPHTLDLLVPVRVGAGGPASGEPSEEPPLPGMVADPREAARAAPFRERFRAALEGTGQPGDLRGWVEVTLTTAPLDALLSRMMGQLAALAGLLLAAGTFLTWLFVRRLTAPLRMLRERAVWIAEGRLDEPFDLVPRPADEVGDLATQFSIMAGRLRKSREALEDRAARPGGEGAASSGAQGDPEKIPSGPRPALSPEEVGERIVKNFASVIEDEARRDLLRARLDKIAHDLKSPLTAIKANAEILAEEADGDPAERARRIGTIEKEVGRLARLADDLPRACREALEVLDRPEGEARLAAPPAPRTPRPGAHPRVLVASRDPDLRSLLREALERGGAEVLEAADPRSAARAAREAAPDVAVVDLLMDGGEGFEILSGLTEDGRAEPIAVVPLNVLREGEAFRAGAIAYQAKPFDQPRLLAEIRSMLPPRGPGAARILVVDDDRFVGQAIGSVLTREGFDVTVAAGGEEGARAALEHRPDLVVADLSMPGLDGIGLIRRLWSRPDTRDSPVVLLTAQAIPEGRAVAWRGAVSREALAAGLRAAVLEAGA